MGKIEPMAAQNIVDLPPYRPGMLDVFRRLSNAFRTHWRDHENKYPQKIILTAQQAEDLYITRCYGAVADQNRKEPPPKTEFWSRPIEISDSTAGVVVAHDGTEMPLSAFDQMPPART